MSTYLIDPAHSSVNFSIKHLMIAKVHGGFEKFSGKVHYDPQNPQDMQVEATIDTSSINTRDSQRDAHLRSAEFFDVDNYPNIIFVSKKIEVKRGELTIHGDLTIHGVTRPVTLEVEGPSEEIKDPWGNVKMGVSATTKVKRKDYGLSWNAALEAGGFLVGDDVNISLDIQLLKQV
jgi:polyisoprenoid-binding protein YceI